MHLLAAFKLRAGSMTLLRCPAQPGYPGDGAQWGSGQGGVRQAELL